MRVLAIATHPDDETLGAGGTLCKHVARGDELHWFIATAAFAPRYTDEQISRQKENVAALERMYGVASLHWPRLPTTRLDDMALEAVIDPLCEAIHEVEPSCIYSVGGSDVHTDHGAVHTALMTSIKAFQRPPGLDRILTYEVISSTDVYPAARPAPFVPTTYSDITEFIERKLEVMSVFKSELHEPPLPRSLESIRALARYRGSAIGVDYAEAFQLVFEAF